MGKGFSIFLIVAWTILFSLNQSVFSDSVSKKEEQLPSVVKGELLVQFKKDFSQKNIQKFLNKYNPEVVRPLVSDPSIYRVRLRQDEQVESVIQELQKNSNVKIAQTNNLYRSQVTPNDIYFDKLWGLNNSGQKDVKGQAGRAQMDIQVGAAWDEGTQGSKQVVVAVIDSGIDWTHPDLEPNLYTNPGEIPGNGVDDDQNGFVDDVHGWNAVDQNGNSQDDGGHGTHCAGTIGAAGNNEVGVVGVNWMVSLLPVKSLGKSGSGDDASAIDAIGYAVAAKANVISVSWGNSRESPLLKAAIEKARDAGILFVASAGNRGEDIDVRPNYPANYDLDNILAVAAIDNQGLLPMFSNYSKTKVHVAAPGVGIVSTVPSFLTPELYAAFSGTSMAAPHVAGAAALMLSVDPTLTYQDIKSRLIQTSTPSRFLKDRVLSGGVIHVYNAIHNITPAPEVEPNSSLWVQKQETVESPHPYLDSPDKKKPLVTSFTVTHTGAKFIRLHFSEIDFEKGFDRLRVMDANGFAVEQLTGKLKDYTSAYIEGDTAKLDMYADDVITGYGFKVDWVDVIE